MKNKKTITLGLMLVMLLLSTLPAYAWYGSYQYATIQDVHLTDTYWWAKDMGFSSREAGIISKSCDGVDVGWRIFDKTWHLDRREDTGSSIDTRIKHANEEMARAKAYISMVPGKSRYWADYYRKQAWEHLGRGIHSIQDIYSHMDAGVGKYVSVFNPSNNSHGMAGVLVGGKNLDGTVNQYEVEYLYDDVLWDYTAAEGWHKHQSKQESTRWQMTRDATKQYMYEFLLYGYGPGK